jgi:glutaredoxin 3
MSEVIIYTKPGCPYCAKAMAWHTERGISFEERNAQDNRQYRREMFKYSDNDPTVPVIVVDGVYKQSGWEGRG